MIEKTCPICHNKFFRELDEHWKKICYDCWKEYRNYKRIDKVGYKSDVYMCHPSVTKEELEQYIRDNKHEHGWGVHEYDDHGKTKVKIWINNTNYD